MTKSNDESVAAGAGAGAGAGAASSGKSDHHAERGASTTTPARNNASSEGSTGRGYRKDKNSNIVGGKGGSDSRGTKGGKQGNSTSSNNRGEVQKRNNDRGQAKGKHQQVPSEGKHQQQGRSNVGTDEMKGGSIGSTSGPDKKNQSDVVKGKTSHNTTTKQHQSYKNDRNEHKQRRDNNVGQTHQSKQSSVKESEIEGNAHHHHPGSKKPYPNKYGNRKRKDPKQKFNNSNKNTASVSVPSSSVAASEQRKGPSSNNLPTVIDEEEIKRNQLLEAEKAAEEERKRLRNEYISSERLRIDQIRTNISTLYTFQSIIEWHTANRTTLTSPTILNQKRIEHANERKKAKSDLKKCTAFVKKVKTSSSFQMSGSSSSSSNTGGGAGATTTAAGTTTTTTLTNNNVSSTMIDEISNHPLLKDVKSLNLSRFVDEIASSLIDAKFKVTEVPVVVALCCGLHERYKEFLPTFLPKLVSHITSMQQQTSIPSSGSSSNTAVQQSGGGVGVSSSSNDNNNDEDKGGGGSSVMKQRRVLLRLLTELVLNGVVTDPKPLVKIVGEAAGAPKSSSSSSSSSGQSIPYHVTDVHLLSSFVKSAGMELLDSSPRSITVAMEAIKTDLKQLSENKKCAVDEPDHDASVADGVTNASTTTTTEEETAVSSSGGERDGDDDEKTDYNKTNQNKLMAVLQSSSNDEEIIQLKKDIETIENEAKELLTTLENITLKERACVPSVCNTLKLHCTNALESILITHQSMVTKVNKLEKRCYQDRLLSGGLSETREKGLSDAQRLLEMSLKSIETLSEALDRDVPTITVDDKQDMEEEEAMGGAAGVEVWTKDNNNNDDGRGDGSSSAHLGPFDDEETRSFYCDIPDLLSTKPAALLGLTPAQVEQKKSTNAFRYGSFESSSTTTSNMYDEQGENQSEFHEKDSSEGIDPSTQQDESTSNTTDGGPDGETDDGDQTGGGGGSGGSQFKLNVLLDEELLECNSREKADELSERFCVNHGSSKNNRKRLSKALCSVPRTRLDLLSQYARVVCTIDHVYDDVAPALIDELESQFHGQAKYKKNINIENRIKITRFIGELTKFRTAPPIVALRCLKRCTDDLTGSNIDISCSLLESCGRFLYRTPHTKQRLSKLLDVMTRIRKAKNLDERSVALLQSAFYMVNPPQRKAWKQTKIYPPLEAYIQYLFTVRLNENIREQNSAASSSSKPPITTNNVSFITKQLLRLPWNDPTSQCGYIVSKHLLKVCCQTTHATNTAVNNEHHGSSNKRDNLYDIIKNLKKSRREVVVRMIDMAIEELQRSMEHPTFRNQQRALGIARLLGGLHNAGLLSSNIIFEQLYKFINYGHEVQPHFLQASASSETTNHSASHSSNKSLLATGDSSKDGYKDLTALKSSSDFSETIPEDRPVGFQESSSNSIDNNAKDTGREGESKVNDIEAPATRVYLNPVPISRTAKYDPRIPSHIDPPNSVLRIKLVCCLLDSCGTSLVNTTQTNNNALTLLRNFFTSFQRYLFTKSILPIEVKFAILDVFDSYDSNIRSFLTSKASEIDKKRSSSSSRHHNKYNKKGATTVDPNKDEITFVRYSSWADAHEATIQLEEAEATKSSLAHDRLVFRAGGTKENKLLNSTPSMEDDKSTTAIDVDMGDDDSSSDGDDDDDDSDDHTQRSEDRVQGEDEQQTIRSRSSQDHAMTFDTEDDSDNESECGSESRGDVYDDDDDDDDDDDNDEDNTMEDKEETASDIEMKEQEALERQLEEEEFERELRKLTLEAVEKGKIAARAGTGGKVADTMVHASQFISKKPHQQQPQQQERNRQMSNTGRDGGESGSSSGDMFGAPPAGISLKLLKKGNKGKVEAKELIVPQNTSLAIQAMKQGEMEARERDLLKARVLQYEQESSLESSGNVYISQEKLQVIRNRPLLMDDIDRNFGTSSGSSITTASTTRDGNSTSSNHHHHHRAGRGRGRVSSRGRGGRTLKHY